jgi:beta-xylosidase
MNRSHPVLVVLLVWELSVVRGPGADIATYRNPIVDAPGAADPCVVLHQGVYHLYATLGGRSYPHWTSTDLVHWVRQADCYHDEREGLWAPDVYRHPNGRWYLYYTVNHSRQVGAASGPQDKCIGVAVCNEPGGPFRNPQDLVGPAIDAHPFRDHDGRLYLYYVDLRTGFRIVGRPMADPVTFAGEPVELIRPDQTWEQAHGAVTEGPWMLKIGTTYYLMYSGSGADGPDYAIGYATSASPLGPFRKYAGNPIARRRDGLFGPGHHCVVVGPRGGLWMLYHQKEDEGINWKRFLALDPLWVDDTGVLHARLSRGTDEPTP